MSLCVGIQSFVTDETRLLKGTNFHFPFTTANLPKPVSQIGLFQRLKVAGSYLFAY